MVAVWVVEFYWLGLMRVGCMFFGEIEVYNSLGFVRIKLTLVIE